MAGIDNLTPFPKGKSGNPNGRPPGRISLERSLKLIMEQEIEYLDPTTGQMRSGHYIDKHLTDLISLSQSSDEKVRIQAIKEINDRYAGRAKQFIEVMESEPLRLDYSLLSEEELEELENVQNRFGELIAKCRRSDPEAQGD